MTPSVVLIIGCLGLFYTALMIFGVTVHDMRQILSRAKQKQHPHTRRHQKRPQVTALLYLDRDFADLELAMSHLLTDRYRKLDIVLIVPSPLFASVQARISRLKSRRAVHIHSSRHSQFSTAIRQAYHRFSNGDLIAVFDKQHLPTADFISKAVEYFNLHNNAPTAYANSLTTSSYSILGLFQAYGDFVDSLHQKALSGLGLSPATDSLGGAVYRQSVFLDLSLNHSSKDDAPRYASELVVLTPAATSLNFLLRNRFQQQRESLRLLWRHRLQRPLIQRVVTFVLLLVSGMGILLTPLIVGYCLFMAIQLHQPLFLSVIALLYAGVILFAIMENETLRTIQKVLYIGLSPITPLAALLLAILQPWNMLGYLARLRPVARLLHKQA